MKCVAIHTHLICSVLQAVPLCRLRHTVPVLGEDRRCLRCAGVKPFACPLATCNLLGRKRALGRRDMLTERRSREDSTRRVKTNIDELTVLAPSGVIPSPVTQRTAHKPKTWTPLHPRQANKSHGCRGEGQKRFVIAETKRTQRAPSGPSLPILISLAP